MIRQNLYLLVKNARYWMAVFLLLFFTGVLLIYQEKSDIFTGMYRAQAIDWALEQEAPAEAADATANAAIQNMLGVNGADAVSQFTGNLYYDYMLWADAAAYLREQQEYGQRKAQILVNLQLIRENASVTDETRIKSAAAYEQYAALQDVSAAQGNFIAWEKFFSSGMADAAVLLAVFCGVYFLVIQEREKGMEHLMFASKNGGCGYFAVKALAISAVSVFLALLFLGLKFAVYTWLYGLGDMSAAVQSMNGYYGCPYALCIWQYVLIFAAWKLAAAAVTGVAMLLICSFPLSEAGCGLMLAALALVCVLLQNGIAPSSSWVWLRDAGPLSLWKTEYWFTGFHCYLLGGMGNTWLMLRGMALPFCALAVYGLLIAGAGLRLYHIGIRKSGRKRRGWNILWRYRGGCAANEALFLGLQKHCFLLAAVLIFLPVYLVLDFDENMNSTVRYERQCVELLNEKTFSDAVAWLENKEAEFDEMEQKLLLLDVQLAQGEITENAYEQLRMFCVNQLTMRPLIDALVLQAEEMEPLRQQGMEVQFEYTALSGQLFGTSGADTRIMLGIFISTFVTFGVLTVFPADRQLGMNRLIGSASCGGKSMTARLLGLMVSVFFVSVILHGIWLYSLRCQYGLTGWSSLMQSWSFYRKAGIPVTVGAALILEILWQGVKWAALAGMGLWISMKTANTVWVQMLGILLYLAPLMLALIGAEWIQYLPYYPLLPFAQQSLLCSWLGGLPAAGLLACAVVLMERGKRRWMEHSLR